MPDDTPISALDLERVTAPLPNATTLPPLAYTDPVVFAAECREVFYKEWICVAREEQIPDPGDYLTFDLVDQPLVVVRQEDGSVGVMSSICPHRAMPVVEGFGNTRTFQCPYHRWKFRLDGTFISAPHMDGVADFPRAGCRLRPLEVETWEGFVFTSLDPEASPLKARLSGLGDVVGGYRMRDMVAATRIEFDCPWNWKILVENFMEAYHHIGPHNESVQPTHHARDSYVSGSVADGWSVLHMPQVEGHGESPDPLPLIEGLSENQKRETLAGLVMPTCAWLLTPSVGFWYHLVPHAHDRMTLYIHTLLPRALAEAPGSEEIAAGVEAVISHIHLEDIAANAGPWRGLNAPLTEPGPLSLLEESIWQINQWWAARIQR